MNDPPELSVKIPSRRDVPYKPAHEFSENFSLDFLLLTAVDCEFLSCYYYLQEPLTYYDTKTGFVFVGKTGDKTEQEKLTIGLMQCDMGSGGTTGSAMTVRDACTILNPKGVFCVGFCGGMNAKKANLGDVAVSRKLISYAPSKATEGGSQLRGPEVPLGKRLSDIMRHAGSDWNPPLMNMEETLPKVVLGTMLSGPILVNWKIDRDKLLKNYPDAIAIEMEGEGVFAAASNRQIEWVVVKGISDYADGTKDSTEKWKPYASVMAASLVAHVLSQPSIFKGWGRYGAGLGVGQPVEPALVVTDSRAIRTDSKPPVQAPPEREQFSVEGNNPSQGSRFANDNPRNNFESAARRHPEENDAQQGSEIHTRVSTATLTRSFSQTTIQAIMSLEGKTNLISPQKWPGWYIYMTNNSDGNVRGWSCDPGPQGHWTLEKIGLNLYRAAPKEWPNWYMYMQSGVDGNVRGWNGDPGHQGHWYVEQKGTVIIEEQHIPTYTFRPKAYPGWYMYMQNEAEGNVRGWNGDPDTQGYFIFTAI